MHQTEGKLLFTLKSGEKKWMTKREYNAYIKRLKSLETLYNDYVDCKIIEDNMATVDQIQTLVSMGNNLMSSICESADSITVSGYNRVTNEVSNKITKPEFIEIVKYVSKHLDAESNVTEDEKLTEKLLKDIDEITYKINLKRIFYSNFNEFNDYVIPDPCESNKVIFPKLSKINNKRFKEIVKSCAKARKYIDEHLWPAFQEYASVAEYVSNGDLNYDRYKQLVDYMHYENTEDPRYINKIDKRYKVLSDKFINSYTLCKKYGYDEYFEDVENMIINDSRN